MKYFKLNEDDIVEIVSEKLAECEKGAFSTKSLILGNAGKDLRIIVAIGELDDDLENSNLEQIDANMDFNGEHSHVKWLTNEELSIALKKMIESGEY